MHSRRIDVMFRNALVFVTTLLVLLSVKHAYADDTRDPEDITHAIHVYETDISYPVPVWFKDGSRSYKSQQFRKQSGPQFIFEYIPKDEKLESWSQMFAIRGDYLKSNKDWTLEGYISASFKPFADVCGHEKLSLAKVSGTQTSQTYALFCEDSPLAPPGSGYGKGVGEIALFKFAKVGDTFVKVYHEWRGKSFLSKTPASWPVKQADLKIMIQRFQSVNIAQQ